MRAQPGTARWWGRVLPWAWPGVLFAVLALAISGYGFNPTDEGLIAAAAQRIVEGQVPHRDFISPRPVISVLLHLPESLLPSPLFLTGRLVALGQVIVYSLLLAWLVLDQSPRLWTVAAVLGITASTLVNLNTAPLMPWYTTDGILFAALGFVMLRVFLAGGRTGMLAAAFGCLALAAMTKQSFAPALAVGAAWLVIASPRGRRMPRLLIGLAAAAVPIGAYVAVVGAAGGWPEMTRQLTSSRPLLGGELLAPLASPVAALLVIGVPAAVIVTRRLVPRGHIADVMASVALTALVLTIVLTSGLRLTGYWGILVTWLVAAYVATQALSTRRIDGTCLILVLLAWMTSLSYGQPVPNVVAGSLVLALLHRTWRDMPPWPMVRGVSPLAIIFVVLFLTVVPAFAMARNEYVHRDAPRAELTADLGELSDELRGIRTNPRTAAYLVAMRQCVAAHPTGWVAVFPDNAAAYPAFGWSNPMPVDFLFPPEYEGSRDRVISATREAAERGDLLVLFQRVRADSLLDPAIDLTGSGPMHTYDAEITDQLRSLLADQGDPVSCGLFDGFYVP